MLKKIKWPGRTKLEDSANILAWATDVIRYLPKWLLNWFH